MKHIPGICPGALGQPLLTSTMREIGQHIAGDRHRSTTVIRELALKRSSRMVWPPPPVAISRPTRQVSSHRKRPSNTHAREGELSFAVDDHLFSWGVT